MIFFIIHDFGDILALELRVFVGMILLFDISNLMASFFSFADGLFSFGCMLDRSGENSVALFVHILRKRIITYVIQHNYLR